MRTRERRALSVLAIVDELRAVHPELMQPVRWRGLQSILAREGISTGSMPIRERAFVQGFDGDFHITLRSGLNSRIVTKVALHEYGHAVLHMTERGEVVRQLHECTRGDARETEADLFAALMWLGPEATPDHPVVAQLVAKIEAPRLIHRPPDQIQLPLPQGVPVFKRPPHRSAFRLSRKAKRPTFDWFAPRQKPLISGSSLGLNGVSHDAIRFRWDRGGKPLAFFSYELGWIDVYDRAVIEQNGQRRAVMLPVGDKRTQQRLFIVSSTDRRRYTFAEGESRGRSVDELNRQIARSVAQQQVQQTRGAEHRVDMTGAMFA